ncbi:MAG: ribonuclease D [Elusimicrobia bacterium]|nr:ribonuclease D [Elusimicrobiota bacterium]
MTLPPVRILTEISHIEWLAQRLGGEHRVAVDLESDGFYVYHEKTCLLQVSSEKEDFIVDPLLAKDLSPLAHLFRDPAVEKVFHAAEYDIVCLKRDLGFQVRSVFDTMAAARTLGKPKLGLANLIDEYFGVVLSKKLQRANWGKRPLSEEQLQYARLDTHYLLRLRDKLEAELTRQGRLNEARDAFRKVERIEPPDKSFDPENYWRLPGARELSPQGLAILKELYFYREKTAASLDRAPFRVLPEPLLVRLAAKQPRTPDDLSQVQGMTPYLFQRHGADMLEGIGRGLQAQPIQKLPEPPPRGEWAPSTAARYEALRAWRKDLAEKRGVEPVVVLENDEAKALAEAPAKSKEPSKWLAALSPFKREAYGPDLLRILRETNAPSKSRRRRRRNSYR